MKRIVVAILAVFAQSLASPAHAQDRAQDMYSFRDFRLGASLSDVRNRPYPDAARWPDAKLICTGDKEHALISREASEPAENLLRAGVTVCQYYRLTSARTYTYWGLDFPGAARMLILLFFTPNSFPEEQRSRLYSISLEGEPRNFDATLAALKQIHGAPHDSKASPFQSGGKTYDNLDVAWLRAGSILIAGRYVNGVNTMYVGYEHQALARAVDRAVQTQSK